MARILQPTSSNLDDIAAYLQSGEIAAIPTETVYGLAGNALDPRAVAKIFKTKGRPAQNPLIVHIESLEQLSSIADISESAKVLASLFWPGPLTMILRKKSIVSDRVTAGLQTVAVRMPSHPIFRELARRCSFPIAAPSANPFGYVSPTRTEHVQQQLGDQISFILDGGPSEKGLESTIVSLSTPSQPELLRYGSISLDSISVALGIPVIDKVNRVDSGNSGLISPGLMKKHYSPNTPIELFSGAVPEVNSNEVVLHLFWNSDFDPKQLYLSETGTMEEAAQNFYHCLQFLDQKHFNKIYLELPPKGGIGDALRDRMGRAAARG
ncbi:MAG: threonylcarbamoyl-AMP synthase [Opitutaceae bacterium]|nr:threonylcarbamoyl-AMP synthase [Opitutaceae bacterium]|tara:strand:- start:7363 stop:8334 length:972 start_codon:yes stop_codon:yes gene_type:complete